MLAKGPAAALRGPARRATNERGTSFEVLGFLAGRENFGVPLSSVREILKPPPVTHVPRAAEHVLGIVSVRGSVVTVTDLRRRLRVDETPIGKQSRILLVDHQGETLGLLVDRVLQVFRLRQDQLELTTSLGGDFAEHVFGIGRPGAGRGHASEPSGMDSDLLILLDLESLLR